MLPIAGKSDESIARDQFSVFASLAVICAFLDGAGPAAAIKAVDDAAANEAVELLAMFSLIPR